MNDSPETYVQIHISMQADFSSSSVHELWAQLSSEFKEVEGKRRRRRKYVHFPFETCRQSSSLSLHKFYPRLVSTLNKFGIKLGVFIWDVVRKLVEIGVVLQIFKDPKELCHNFDF